MRTVTGVHVRGEEVKGDAGDTFSYILPDGLPESLPVSIPTTATCENAHFVELLPTLDVIV